MSLLCKQAYHICASKQKSYIVFSKQTNTTIHTLRLPINQLCGAGKLQLGFAITKGVRCTRKTNTALPEGRCDQKTSLLLAKCDARMKRFSFNTFYASICILPQSNFVTQTQLAVTQFVYVTGSIEHTVQRCCTNHTPFTSCIVPTIFLSSTQPIQKHMVEREVAKSYIQSGTLDT